MKKAFTWWTVALTVALLAGCSDASPGAGSARFAVSMPQALASNISRVSVTSSASGIPSVTVDLAPTHGVWGGIIGNIPAGANRSFRAQAFDASGSVLFAGSASRITIAENQTSLVAITLQQVNPPPPFGNEAPLIDSLVVSSTTVPAGGSISLVATAHDPNPGDTLSHAWSATAGSFSSPSDASTSWTAPVSTGIQSLTLTVTDSRGLSSRIVLAVNVTLGGGEGDAQLSISFNSSPQVASLTASPTQLIVGQTTAVSVSASDPDGDRLSYAWSASCAGSWINASSRSARFTPSLLPAGSCNNCRLTVSVSDGQGGLNTGTVALCIRDTPPAPQFPPVIIRSYRSSDSASPGQVLTYEVVASDPQGAALSFAWAATTGSLGQESHDALRSRITWTAPACVSAGTPPTVTVTVTNAFSLTATRSFAVTGLPACGPSGNWTMTGPMGGESRRVHTAVLLPGGKVLVVGGSLDTARAAEVYDPGSNTWSFTRPMVEVRVLPTTTLLPNGKVLVAGGSYEGFLATAELYDPASGTWSPTGSMAEARLWHTATLLPNGKVLVAGGNNGTSEGLLTAELYDPASGTWSPTGSLPEPLGRLATATLLANGKVLGAGGYYTNGTPLTTAEVYDPASGTWSVTGSMLEPLIGPAMLLPNGKVLAVGGGASELYDPASGTWSATGSPPQHFSDAATLLLSGKVLSVDAFGAKAELYDPASDTWSPTASLNVDARDRITATRLLDGRALIVGPTIGDDDPASAELYTP
ncbi:Kelch repeat-containing protein [Corallococcus sicarius]|uniref:Kelch repeat-containing protein n=1 Tax=Corallococcus sicarius TaxID=2316726 RepID=A0A3A8MZF0_9BACT|nr:kelch repeat-containing protein [Corallococcus sicarius]RKH37396.1 kelch repeat-containing protein [Corallococcus sicarius]